MTDSTQNKKTILIVAAVLVFAGILLYLDIYDCPLDLILGIPCPLCGATRAVLCVVCGRFHDAFYYHPLWPLFIISGAVFALDTLGVIKVKKAVASATVWFLSAALLICYIIRHITGSPVVAIHFEDSLLNRIILTISTALRSLL